MKLRRIPKAETCGKKGTYTLTSCGVANSRAQVTANDMFTAKNIFQAKTGSQNWCRPRIIQIRNDRFYTSEKHTHNSPYTAGLGPLFRARKITIFATMLGPVYMKRGCTEQEGRPPSRVNFSKLLSKKKG